MRKLRIGTITRPHGLRGEVRVLPDTDLPDRFQALRRVLVAGSEGEVPYEVESVRPHGRFFLVKLRGVESREAAEALRDGELCIPEEEASPLPEGTYYVADILGLEVRTTEGEVLGRVREVLRTGANDVYVVAGEREILLPAIEDVIQEVNLGSRYMVVRLLPGLVD
ncbi:MAG: ribosome maturation factor RimM [Armatimonadota bacterium]|nr:ribosome maturation factor RimM [Armatimonadota bacterium]MDR7439883.1 ribosome maturation factor RimM [Armatimonadota bacterium]MDR7563322.1 ribosome maturation factor RimM [Armatimonadota bacterium]MDR7567476.1 ribosome maturation factor RimM [Armatimonadota bacterium]MDR7601975.1 ribosome maturation factor RimM [Armatimonadota bacterium]